MFDLRQTKADRRDDTYYREPTVEEKAARHARLQSRCPYDLRTIEEWPDSHWIEWGRQLRGRMPNDRSMLEGLALIRANQYDERLDELLAYLLTNFDQVIEGMTQCQTTTN